MNFFEELKHYDAELYAACDRELSRQRHNIELIASENIVSKAVLLAAGTVLTNKYAEGYPGKRYYGGCEYIDEVETLAIERAKKLFGADHANVQPHCGASANLAVFLALVQPGDTVMGLSLAHGGHLSHGSPANISGKYYNIVSYGVDEKSEVLDYEAIRQKALECKPKMIIAGASAYSRTIDFEKIGEIAKELGLSAIGGKAKTITVIMPMLYEGRQHKRSSRESLDCAVMLQELCLSMGVDNIITFDAHDARVQNAIPLNGFESISPSSFNAFIRAAAEGPKRSEVLPVTTLPSVVAFACG